MRRYLALLGLWLALSAFGSGSALASPNLTFQTKEPTLLLDPSSKSDQLYTFIQGLEWLAEQEAFRGHLFFPHDRMQADVPIGPRWEHPVPSTKGL